MKRISKSRFALFSVVFVFGILFPLYIKISMSSYYGSNDGAGVSIRKFPYPYKAALAISNDVDETFTLKEFLTINEYLTTHNETVAGKGLALEIGASFYAKALQDRFALLSGNPADKNVIMDLIRLGYVDFIHSYNKISSREEIAAVIDTLIDNDCPITTWVNHADVSNNVGDLQDFSGDNPGQAVYHSDLTTQKLGCLFFWQDQLTGIIGQERPISPLTFFDHLDWGNLFSTFSKYTLPEVLKYFMAALGSNRYEFRKYNQLLRVSRLDDGRPVFEFQRGSYCDYGPWGDCATMDGFADSMSEKVIHKLIENNGYAVVFTHFGKNDGFPYIPQRTRKALRHIAAQKISGNLYLTTTTKLLSYFINRKYLDWTCKTTADTTAIVIKEINDPVRGAFIPSEKDLQGLTFYTPRPQNTEIYISGKHVQNIKINKKDGLGMASVMIRFSDLAEPDSLYREYKIKGYF